MDNQLTTIPGTRCIISGPSASLPEAMTFSEWEDCIGGLQFLDKNTKFWLGDLIIAGEERFGEMYAQALDATSYGLSTLQNIVYVCRNVDMSIRDVDGCLTFAHNEIVAKLPSDEQIMWLRRAKENNWTTKILRDAVKEANEDEETEERYAPDLKVALQNIRAETKKIKFNAVPKSEDIQKMILCIQNVNRVLTEYGV